MQTKTPYIPTREQKSAVPLGNFDIHEDENILVNRLYYAVPNFEDGTFSAHSSMRKTRSAKMRMEI